MSINRIFLYVPIAILGIVLSIYTVDSKLSTKVINTSTGTSITKVIPSTKTKVISKKKHKYDCTYVNQMIKKYGLTTVEAGAKDRGLSEQVRECTK